MNRSSDCQYLQLQLNRIRVGNANSQKFVPENELRAVMVRDLIMPIVKGILPSHRAEERVTSIIEGAQKVFGILVLIDKTAYIDNFIWKDRFQPRHIDHLLPFGSDQLRAIINEDDVTDLFLEKQWEFCAPIFSGRIIPRTLEDHTILPFLTDDHLTEGGYGSVYKIRIHLSHQPRAFDQNALVCNVPEVPHLSSLIHYSS